VIGSQLHLKACEVGIEMFQPSGSDDRHNSLRTREQPRQSHCGRGGLELVGDGGDRVDDVELSVAGASDKGCAGRIGDRCTPPIPRPAAIAELLLRAPAGRWPHGTQGTPAITTGVAEPELLDAAARLLRLLDHAADAAVLAPLITQEILWRLLAGPLGGTTRQIGLADSDLSHVSRAIAWIRDNYAEPMRIDDLARLSGMSASAFHRHFRAVTAMSPLQFQKRIRLQHARALLVAHPGDIAGVGHHVGYESPSQFNREYRRLFGAPPGQDAGRLRTETPVPATL
jgi:AraC-like DNA-binding protein